MGNLSRNFSASEFRCGHCGRIGYVSPVLVQVLQRARDARGVPLRIVSGWRCPEHNRAVGGIATSQHLRGRAADVPRGYGTVAQWRSWGAIGIGVRTGGVVHVDVTPGRSSFTFDD